MELHLHTPVRDSVYSFHFTFAALASWKFSNCTALPIDPYALSIRDSFYVIHKDALIFTWASVTFTIAPCWSVNSSAAFGM